MLFSRSSFSGRYLLTPLIFAIIVSSARVACFFFFLAKERKKKSAVMYKYRFIVAVVEGNIFLWASNREIKDYLEFASENLATIITYA